MNMKWDSIVRYSSIVLLYSGIDSNETAKTLIKTVGIPFKI